MKISVIKFRNMLLASPIIGKFILWGYRHYITAKCLYSINDCENIPKIKDAGVTFNMGSNGSVPYQLMHNGLKIKLGGYYDNFHNKIIEILRGHHEPQQEYVFHKVLESLPDNITMIEVGSYWGYYSMWAQKAKKRVKNYLIEPSDEGLNVGQENFALNNMEGEFIRAYVGASSKGPHIKKLGGTLLQAIERISVDDFMKRRAISFAHIIHADIQGDELELLKGACQTIQDEKVGYFFISTHDSKLHFDCLEYLKEKHFVIVASHSRKESFSSDGFICARAKNFDGVNYVEISKSKGGLVSDAIILLKYLFSGAWK